MQDRLTVAQVAGEALETALDVGGAGQQPVAVGVLDHRAQRLGAADEREVALQEAMQRLGFAPIAVGHVIFFGNGMGADLAFERADVARHRLQPARRLRRRRVWPRLFAGRRGQMRAAIGALGALDLLARLAKQPADLGAHRQVVGAQMVLQPVEIIAPAVEQVDGDLLQRLEVVEDGRHLARPVSSETL